MYDCITNHKGYWLFTGDDPNVFEHFFVEAKLVQDSKTIFIQVDLCDGEYTFSAAKESARPFFDNDLPMSSELPVPSEIFGSLEDASNSPYIREYRKYLKILEKAKTNIQTDSINDALPKIFGPKTKGKSPRR